MTHFEYIGRAVSVRIDRPRGSLHPLYSGLLYEVDYGHIPGTVAPDGEPFDAYVLWDTRGGSVVDGFCIGVIHRPDGDHKLVVTRHASEVMAPNAVASMTRFQEQHFTPSHYSHIDRNEYHIQDQPGDVRSWHVGLGMTGRCNMQCAFCYSKATRHATDLAAPDLDAFFFRNAHRIGSINYGTGENTLHSAWPAFVECVGAYGRGRIRQSLTTNGYLTEAIRLDSAAEVALGVLDEVDISLDFADETSHNQSRGNANAYQWVQESLEVCKAAGIVTTIVVVGTEETLTAKNLAGLFRIAGDGYLRINLMRPNGGHLRPPSFQRVTTMLGWLLDNYRLVAMSDPLFSAWFLRRPSPDPSGSQSFRILPSGAITPSTYLITEDHHTMNIKDAELGASGFDARLCGSIGDIGRIPDECSGCPIGDICRGGAVDRRFLWYATLNARDPYCPFRWGGTIDQTKTVVCDPAPQGSPRIHTDYLPTLLFSGGH